jgi:hypothetical protein
MNKSKFVLVTLLLLVFSLTVTNGMAQGAGAGKGKQKNSTPFLITGKMPHLTKMLMQHWDNAELNLSDDQKSKLLVIRKETIGSAQKLGKEISPLENQVAAGSLSGKTPEKLKELVQKVAELRAEATMVHLQCIYNTSNILNEKQLALLNNL